MGIQQEKEGMYNYVFILKIILSVVIAFPIKFKYQPNICFSFRLRGFFYIS